MGDRIKRLLEVHKAHIKWLLVLACLVHQYSEICDSIVNPSTVHNANELQWYIVKKEFSIAETNLLLYGTI